MEEVMGVSRYVSRIEVPKQLATILPLFFPIPPSSCFQMN